MNIDRSNYEIWFIDWLDGSLNSVKTKELMLFLEQNSDLREEFNEMTNLRLSSPDNSFQFKNDLKKSPEEISISQFEYISAAYLENDLTESQKSEIREIIEKDHEKKIIFEQINKTHLIPLNIKYKYKKRLQKSTPVQKIIRFSAIGLSTAAAITLIISSYISHQGTFYNMKSNEAHIMVSDSNFQRSSVGTISNKRNIDINQLAVSKITAGKSTSKTKEITVEMKAELAGSVQQDSSLINSKNREIIVDKVPVVEFSGISEYSDTYSLMASTIILKEPETDDGRSKIGKYLARTFREKFLKEKTPPDAPLKGYEIAEVGVSGINKIFGWEMALDKKTDESGNLKSVYFSSKILKFNAPIKKSVPLP